MTIAECLRWAKALLPADSANLEAHLLLEQVSGLERTTLFAWPERELAPSVVQHYRALVDRRASGVPVAYLLGRREFYGLDLHVDQRVLIPRPETELLVDVALGLALDVKAEVLDLGTGSGAIALGWPPSALSGQYVRSIAAKMLWTSLRPTKNTWALRTSIFIAAIGLPHCRSVSLI